MSDKMRWRYGDTNPVIAAVDAGTVIEIGDLLYMEVDDVRPASMQSDQGSLTGNQDIFANKFLGVAMQRSRSGETTPIRVATSGVFEMDCAVTTFELGDMIGAVENTAGNALVRQQVAKVAAAKYAIGRAAKRQTSATAVLVNIISTVMTGGVEGSSYVAP